MNFKTSTKAFVILKWENVNPHWTMTWCWLESDEFLPRNQFHQLKLYYYRRNVHLSSPKYQRSFCCRNTYKYVMFDVSRVIIEFFLLLTNLWRISRKRFGFPWKFFYSCVWKSVARHIDLRYLLRGNLLPVLQSEPKGQQMWKTAVTISSSKCSRKFVWVGNSNTSVSFSPDVSSNLLIEYPNYY